MFAIRLHSLCRNFVPVRIRTEQNLWYYETICFPNSVRTDVDHRSCCGLDRRAGALAGIAALVWNSGDSRRLARRYGNGGNYA